MNKRTFAIAAFAIFVATPLGSADWKSFGSSEPDTAYDLPSLMWDTEPTGQPPRIYFNAYTTSSTLIAQGVNPNVGALRTQIEPFGQEQQHAILGVWTDCNGDGYVGMAESALREYPAHLLPSNTPCTPQSTTHATCWRTLAPGETCPDWPATGFNNFKGWVTELIPITNDDKTRNSDRRTIYDAASAVWGDYGKPDEPSTSAGGGTCAISPLPRGTMQSSGGVLSYVDCRTGVLEVVNIVFADSHTVGGVTVPGLGDPLGLRFANDDDGTSNPTLGGQETLGDEDSSNAIVRTGDCNADPLITNEQMPHSALRDNTGDGVRSPDTNYVNTDGNVAGTVNHTVESGPFATVPGDTPEQGPDSTSNCDFGDDRGSDAYTLEGDFNGVSASDKREADWNFIFQIMTRGGPLGVAVNAGRPVHGIAGGQSGVANDGGVTHASGYVGEGPSQWFGGSTLTNKPPQTLTTRGTVAGGDFAADIDRGYWLSFYAYTTAPVGATPGGTGKYGSSQCPLGATGAPNGWNCDPTVWNTNPDGSPIPDPFGSFAYIGKTYNHRDVDCYDGGVMGVGTQPAFYGGGACRFG